MDVLLIIGGLLALLLLRVPVAFAMGGLGVLLLWLKGFPLVAVPQRLFGAMDSFELLAVPLFLLMSNVLLKGNVGRDLFGSVQAWVGHWPVGWAWPQSKAAPCFRPFRVHRLPLRRPSAQLPSRRWKNADMTGPLSWDSWRRAARWAF